MMDSQIAQDYGVLKASCYTSKKGNLREHNDFSELKR
jgi:hypothetical protein